MAEKSKMKCNRVVASDRPGKKRMVKACANGKDGLHSELDTSVVVRQINCRLDTGHVRTYGLVLEDLLNHLLKADEGSTNEWFLEKYCICK